jgi:hypothetical protein
MFSTHQTILASLYKNRLDAEWMWRKEEDIDAPKKSMRSGEFDYDEMGKPEHDSQVLGCWILLNGDRGLEPF